MEIFDLQPSRAVLEIAIHEIETAEVSLLRHLVGGEDFDHPIHHFGPQGRTDPMPQQQSSLSLRTFAQMTEDIRRVILPDERSVCFLELLPQGHLAGEAADRGEVGGFADLMLQLELADGHIGLSVLISG
jgi:hypothetical protein